MFVIAEIQVFTHVRLHTILRNLVVPTGSLP